MDMVRNFFVWLFAVLGARLLIWAFLAAAMLPFLSPVAHAGEGFVKGPVTPRYWRVVGPFDPDIEL